MATPSEIITMINDELPTNGDNEITASVLRPVLIAMVNQINGLVGKASELPAGSNNVIDSINNSTSSGITILTGTKDPNVDPPSSFDIGDFYKQTISSIIVGFWQFNGLVWAEIISRREQKIRNVYATTGNYTLDINDDVVIATGGYSSVQNFTLPQANMSTGKIYTIVNTSDQRIFIRFYEKLNDFPGSDLPANKSLTVISERGSWKQINN